MKSNLTFFLICSFVVQNSLASQKEKHKNIGMEIEADKVEIKILPKDFAQLTKDFSQKQTNLTETSDRQIVFNGNVIAKYQDLTLFSNSLSYIGKTNNLVANKGKVVYLNGIEGGGGILLFDEITGTKDLQNAQIKNLFLRNKDVSFKSHFAQKKADEITLHKPTFSACDLDCDSQPLWSFRSSTVLFNQTEEEIKAKHSILFIKKVPVFYLPYFSKHIGKNKNSGILAPKIIFFNSQTGLSVPYFIGSEDGKKGMATFYPEVYLNQIESYARSANIGLEYVLNKDNIKLEFAGKVAPNAQAYGSKTELQNRYYGGIIGSYNFNENLSTDVSYWNMSDNYFRRQYDIRFENYLFSQNSLKYINKEDNLFANIRTLDYKTISIADQKYIPKVLPQLGYTKKIKGIADLTLSGNALAVRRDSGYNSNRLFQNIMVSKKFKTDIGIESEVYSILGTTFYNTWNQDEKNSETNTSRIVPSFGLNNSIPLIAKNGSFSSKIEPILNINYTKEGKNSNKIINEDSAASVLTAQNIFERTEISGIDFIEEGLRLNYGLKFDSFHKSTKQRYSTIVGQKYKTNIETQTNSSVSNYITQFNATIPGFGTINQEAIFNTSLRTVFNRSYFTLKYFSLFDFGVGYLFMSPLFSKTITTDTNQLNYILTLKWSDTIKTSMIIIQNLNFINSQLESEDRITSIEFKISKITNCLEYGFGVRKTNYLVTSGANNMTFIFDLKLKNFTEK